MTPRPNQQSQITKGLTVHENVWRLSAPRQLGEIVANVAGVIDELTLGTHYTCSLAVDTARKHGP